MRFSKTIIPKATALLSLGLMTALSPCSAKKTTVTCYQQTGASEVISKAFEAAAAAFEKRHPDIDVKIVPSSPLDKILTAMVGGVAPDCCMIDERIPSYAIRNIVKPIDPYIKKSRIDPEDFWAPSWRECIWQGKVYAMPWGTDANFGLFINKELFKEAGITPNSPKTIADLDSIAPKFVKQDDKGNLKRIAIVPWSAYGYTNSMYTWGWCFGGEFYDAKNHKITATDPAIVKALDWIRTFALKHGGSAKFGAIDSGIKTGNNFTNGRLAMAIYHAQELPYLRKYAANIDMAIGSMPVDQGVKEDPTWVGGWKIAMLPSTKHPDATWEWIRYITADPEGTAILNEPIGWFPSYKKSSVYPRYDKDPLRSPFFKILQKASHQRPVMPAASAYAEKLDQALGLVLSGKREPAAALEECRTATQKELDRILAKYKVK